MEKLFFPANFLKTLWGRLHYNQKLLAEYGDDDDDDDIRNALTAAVDKERERERSLLLN